MLWNLHILEKPCHFCEACPCESRERESKIYSRAYANKIPDQVRDEIRTYNS